MQPDHVYASFWSNPVMNVIDNKTWKNVERNPTRMSPIENPKPWTLTISHTWSNLLVISILNIRRYTTRLKPEIGFLKINGLNNPTCLEKSTVLRCNLPYFTDYWTIPCTQYRSKCKTRVETNHWNRMERLKCGLPFRANAIMPCAREVSYLVIFV